MKKKEDEEEGESIRDKLHCRHSHPPLSRQTLAPNFTLSWRVHAVGNAGDWLHQKMSAVGLSGPQ